MSLLSDLVGLFGGGHHQTVGSVKQSLQQRPQPSTPFPFTNPLSAGNVEGTIASKTAADSAGFKPSFLQSLLKTMPYQQQKGENFLPKGAGAEYEPGINRITLGQASPGSIAHENLHNVWFRQTPQQQQNETSLIRSGLSPSDTGYINSILGSSLYDGGNVDTPDLATELHSYAGSLGLDLNKPTQNYYNQFFPQNKLMAAQEGYNARNYANPKYLAKNLGLAAGAVPYNRVLQGGFGPYRGDIAGGS